MLDAPDGECLRIGNCPEHGGNLKFGGKNILHGINDPCDIHDHQGVYIFFLKCIAGFQCRRRIPDQLRIYHNLHTGCRHGLPGPCKQIITALAAGFHRAGNCCQTNFNLFHFHILPSDYSKPAIFNVSTSPGTWSSGIGRIGILGSLLGRPKSSTAFLMPAGKLSSAPITLVRGAML